MRIVIDLQVCQHGTPDDARTSLALAQALVRQAGAHEVWIALGTQWPDTIEALRHAFAGLLPAERVRAFDSLNVEGNEARANWLRLASQQLRDNFLLNLAPDAVFAPALFARENGDATCAPRSPSADILTAFSIDGEAPWQRNLDSLRYADLLLVSSAAGRDAQIAAYGKAPEKVVELAADHDTNAERIWSLLGSALAARQSGAAPAKRPRLAYLSPLPPEQSGIADYSAAMVLELSRWYDIDIIVDQPNVTGLAAHFAVRDPAWFDAHADEFDRKLYHFGNNHMHRHLFELLQRHPGTVVLHDFFLSGVVDQMDRGGYRPGAFYQALYQSHGYTGLADHERLGRNEAIWAMPANKTVLDHAMGVIVHSPYARALATRWYGAEAAQEWRLAPLPRTPLAQQAPAVRRDAARARLDLGAEDFIVCSFGMMGDTKLNDELIDAFLASPLANDKRCQLIFVGQNAGTEYGAAVAQKIAASPVAKRIVITGFVSPETYADYAAAADIAVQLRRMSRGETSAAILDCLLYGAATIINAHGAGADVPDDVVLKLADNFTVNELSAALGRLHSDPVLRTGLGQRGAAFVASEHAPGRAGQLYHEAIEHFATHRPQVHYRQLLKSLSRLPAPAVEDGDDLLATARAIAFNQPPAAPRQLFVDVSALRGTDLKTGIQRVVRSVLQALVATPPPGFRIEPVFGEGANRPYRYARAFMLDMLGITPQQLTLEDAPIEARPGDIFLGLDLFTNGTSQNRQLLQDLRRRGVQVHFVVYDILPMLRPECFPYGTEEYFGIFLDTVTQVADGIVCISRAVADELAQWMEPRSNPRQSPLKLGWFHLGADINASRPSFGLPDNAALVFENIDSRPSLLMVGTLEPRKGHGQVLAALDILWKQGVEVNLIIVGKEGWMVEQVATRLKNHPQREQRLFWLAGASDEMLVQLYQKCSALLAASEGEGFGLPLIEAAQHGIPIIARNLPVFQEVAGTHAFYFDATTPVALAEELNRWLEQLSAGEAPTSAAMPWLTWNQSAQQLMDVILGQQWYRELAYPSPGKNS